MSNNSSGILFSYFEFAVLLSIPVSLVLLAWYRGAVRRGMLVQDAAMDTTVSLPISPPESASPHTVGSTEPAARRLRIRLAAIYVLGAIAASAVTTFLYFHQSSSLEVAPLRVFGVGYSFCWPLAPSIGALLALPRRSVLLVSLGYFLIGAAIIFSWSLLSLVVLGRHDVSPMSNVRWYSIFLLLVAGPPYVIIVITSGRKIRPVTPLVLAGLLLFSFAALLFLNGFTTLIDSSATTRNLLLAVPQPMFVWFMLASLPVGYACWFVLRGLGRSFETKRFSDTQLLVDTWWFIAIFSICVTYLATEAGWWGLLGLLGFVAYRITVAVGLTLWSNDRATPGPQVLLLLRVFGYQRRTEQLFDAVAQPWRFKGNVTMIAGADLAGRIIDPGDIVSFASGRLRDEFVHNGADLQRRLRGLDENRDPDGRFRVIKFFCHADIWQPTVESLMQRSDVVLMDLRGFSGTNSGCLFELQKLAGQRKLAHTLFVVDDETDVDLLRATLVQASRDAGFESAPPIHFAQLGKQSGRDLQRVMTKLRALPAV